MDKITVYQPSKSIGTIAATLKDCIAADALSKNNGISYGILDIFKDDFAAKWIIKPKTTKP